MIDDYYRGEPLRIGSATQLLVNDTVIEDRWKLTRVLHPPVKFAANPVLLRDKPWEGDSISVGSVIKDPEAGKYRMWYVCFSRSNYFGAGGPSYYVAHAQSDDGVRWEKPLTDHCPYGQYGKTNIVYYGDYKQGPKGRRHHRVQMSQVFRDEDDPDPERRYKMVCLAGRPNAESGEVHSGLNLACSADGLKWKLSGEKAILDYHSDCKNHLVRDEHSGLWLMYCRPTVYASGRSGIPPKRRHHRRRVSVMTSEDMEHWTYPRIVYYPDEFDWPDFDHVRAFRYGNTFLMLNGVMRGDDSGRKEVRLASSSDGVRWHPFEPRTPYLARGPEGSWEAGSVLPGAAPVREEEMLLLYYRGSTLGQHEPGLNEGGVGLARTKVDRFVEQRAEGEVGYLLTKEFILEGSRLVLNLASDRRAYRDPSVRVEVVRHPPMGGHWRFAEAFDGFGLDDCDPLSGDRTEVTVTWKGNADLSPLAGKPIYLRFELRDAGLFSFRIDE